jgi:hypothetical protein
VKTLIPYLKYLAVAGNSLFILWLLYNGMDEGWRGSPYQIVSYIALVFLLLLNSALLFYK